MTAAATAAFDTRMMTIALAMAQRGLGSTAPNPSVGAVIADPATGEVISRGWTQPGGRPHAEKEALRRAGDRARGKTMYVTLEPCAHTGRLPTCSDSIVNAGLARVVCALPDPNHIVAGHGFAQLNEAGIDVDVGLLGNRARWITLGHILRQTQRRPFVQIKMAVSADGKIARGDGTPVWVTGPEARADGHLLRAGADAIIVGGMTVRADDPELTCRLPGLQHRSPVRVVLSPRMGLPLQSRLVRDARRHPLWLVTAALPGVTHDAMMAAGVVVHTVPDVPEVRLWIIAVLEKLAAAGLTRVLVEGGPRTWKQCLSAGVADEVIIYSGTEAAAAANAVSVVPGGDCEAYCKPFGMVRVATDAVGADTRHVFRRAIQ